MKKNEYIQNLVKKVDNLTLDNNGFQVNIEDRIFKTTALSKSYYAEKRANTREGECRSFGPMLAKQKVEVAWVKREMKAEQEKVVQGLKRLPL